jgi:homoserine kinase
MRRRSRVTSGWNGDDGCVRLTVRAPATVANLGSGFDCLALALDLYNEFTLDTSAEAGVEVRGEGAGELGSGRVNLVLRAIEHAFVAAERSVPAFHLRCVNRIPLRRGLGSSATAAVAGALFAGRLLGEEGADPLRVVDHAVELEGHADNVAACVVGGLALAYRDAGAWFVERLEPNPSLQPVVLVPDEEEIETASTRAALPERVAFADATFALSRVALAVHGFTARPELLRVALQDRLHQRRRLEMAPLAAAEFERLTEAGVPVCVAGSGPSLLAFATPERPVPEPADGWRVLRVSVARRGAVLSSEVEAGDPAGGAS